MSVSSTKGPLPQKLGAESLPKLSTPAERKKTNPDAAVDIRPRAHPEDLGFGVKSADGSEDESKGAVLNEVA